MTARCAQYMSALKIVCNAKSADDRSGTVAHIQRVNDVTRARRVSRQPADARRADVMAVSLKVWRHFKNPTPSTDAYLLEKQQCQVSSRSDLKRQSFGLFMKRVAPRTRTRWLSIWDRYLIRKRFWYKSGQWRRQDLVQELRENNSRVTHKNIIKFTQ